MVELHAEVARGKSCGGKAGSWFRQRERCEMRVSQGKGERCEERRATGPGQLLLVGIVSPMVSRCEGEEVRRSDSGGGVEAMGGAGGGDRRA